ncbi:MAG: hypothetical protein ACXVJD_00270 [Mucilaginibacter sp.]
MKKVIAIVLLGLQMFTICGHIILYQYFVYRSDQVFNDQISQNRYNINDLVEIKVPIHTSIPQNWKYFENVNGQVQFKNTCYNYVKLKMARDTIYLVCIPNYEKTRLFNQNIINAKEIADIPVTKKDHVPFGKNIDLGAYNRPVALFKFAPPVILLCTAIDIACAVMPVNHLEIPDQPPRMLC